MLLAHNSTRLCLLEFRRNLLQFEWSKTVSNLGMSRLEPVALYHWPSSVPLLLLQELHITPLYKILYM